MGQGCSDEWVVSGQLLCPSHHRGLGLLMPRHHNATAPTLIAKPQAALPSRIVSSLDNFNAIHSHRSIQMRHRGCAVPIDFDFLGVRDQATIYRQYQGSIGKASRTQGVVVGG